MLLLLAFMVPVMAMDIQSYIDAHNEKIKKEEQIKSEDSLRKATTKLEDKLKLEEYKIIRARSIVYSS